MTYVHDCEGNERLGRILSTVILVRAGYTFFGEIGISALIARKSYGYYEAIANILRDENSGDLTYFFEYYLEILSRAVDERRLRNDRINAETQRAEAEMARSVLSITPKVESAQPPEAVQTEEPQEAIVSEEAVEPEAEQGELLLMEGGEIDVVRLVRLRDELYKSMARGDGKLSRCSRLLLRYLDLQKYSLTSVDFEKDIPVTATQASNLVTHLKAKGIIVPTGKTGKYAVYTMRLAFAPLTEADYSAQMLRTIKELSESASSPKDKRLGCVLSGCLSKGLVTAADYKAIGQESRLSSDMLLAQRMGLVKKIDNGVYRIEKTIKSGPPPLRKSQKEAITEIYETFGDELFSRDMIIASLDYSAPQASATLHELTLLRILECRKEDGLLYQLLVNPDEHPEYFTNAS